MLLLREQKPTKHLGHLIMLTSYRKQKSTATQKSTISTSDPTFFCQAICQRIKQYHLERDANESSQQYRRTLYLVAQTLKLTEHAAEAETHSKFLTTTHNCTPTLPQIWPVQNTILPNTQPSSQNSITYATKTIHATMSMPAKAHPPSISTLLGLQLKGAYIIHTLYFVSC